MLKSILNENEKHPKFKVGNHVGIKVDKGYTLNWSEKFFKVGFSPSKKISFISIKSL